MSQRTINGYEVVEGHDIADLNKTVDWHLDKGWQPLGCAQSVKSVDTDGRPCDVFIQTLVSYAD